MNIYSANPLNYLINLRLNSSNLFNQQAIELIPVEWRLILLNDGSFTQNLNSLTGQEIKVYPVEVMNKKMIRKRGFRYIYLTNYYNKQLAFARSFWKLETKNKTNAIIDDKPIGQSFIEYQSDIYKDIHEIYLAHCAYLECKFKSNKPIWGRKYTLHYHNKPIATVQEFFSPYLINFFNHNKT
uniref:Chorismate lyase n=1 Tax=Melanthalia intermedia TaxID=172989 RepID=A0A345UAK0_9FLOR|nr:hypothetical protein [Melanthalia intermedia]AXI97486.1 hypothetical protein [Melanthalia intermedia]